jgi:hypothetical protein
MGRIDHLNRHSVEQVPTWLEQSGMLGMRFAFIKSKGEQAFLEFVTGVGRPLLVLAERHSVPVMLYVPGWFDGVEQIVQHYPGLTLILDHLALPLDSQLSELPALMPGLLALAQYNNLFVKASGLIHFSCDAYPFSSVHELIYQVLDAYGPRRVFWGTDHTRLTCTYLEATDLFRFALERLTPDERGLIMGTGLLDVLNWAA